jgi:hypothetical protein
LVVEGGEIVAFFGIDPPGWRERYVEAVLAWLGQALPPEL